jgi:serine/threonine protein kinase
MPHSWEFKPGDQLGQYTIVKCLGSGRFSQGYLSKHERYGEIFLKVFNQDVLDVNSILDEAFAMAYFNNHPHIVKVYEARYVEDYPILSMEYVAGGSLDSKLMDDYVATGSKALPTEKAVGFVYHLTFALGDLHAEKIVHRDVKPANILLKQEYGQETAKLADFGCAIYLHDEKARQAAGTLAYMAPEVIMGADCLPQSDIYSLGIVLYELLTGQIPFRFFDREEFQFQITQGLQVPWPADLAETIPSGILTICRKAVAFKWDAAAQKVNLDDRYQTVEEFRAVLSAFIQGEHSTIATGGHDDVHITDLALTQKKKKAEDFLKRFHQEKNALLDCMQEELKKIVFSAVQQAADFGNCYLGIEHLVAAMLKRKGILWGRLADMNRNPRELGARIVEQIEYYENNDPTRVFTERLLKVVAVARNVSSSPFGETEFLQGALRESNYVTLMLRQEGFYEI